MTVLINPYRFGGGGGGFSSPTTLTADHTQAGTADTSNFVMLVSEMHAEWKSTGNGGQVGNVNDFRFASDSGGSTLLTWSIVSWDATTGQLVAKVNIGTLSHTSDTVNYMLWDGTGRGSPLGGNPWDSNYKGVLGFGDGTTLVLTDETTNANNGTNHNTAVAAAGPNGLGGVAFTFASSQYISTANTINITHCTLEAWIYVPANIGQNPGLFGVNQGGGLTDKDLTLNDPVSGLASLSWYIFDGAGKFVSPSAVFSYAGWHYLVGTADGTNSRLYLDGAEVAVSPTAAGNTYTGYGAAGWQIGGPTVGGSSYGTFTASEARLSDTARSASYVLATYNNYSSPSTFYTLV